MQSETRYANGVILFLILIIVFASSFVSVKASFQDDLVIKTGTYFGGASNFGAFRTMAVDSQGYVYGVAYGSDYPATAGAYKTVRTGSTDIAIFKLSSDLRSLIWCTYLGGSTGSYSGSNVGDFDDSFDMAVTSQGEVVLCGITYCTDFPITQGDNRCGSNRTISPDSVGIFLLKFNASGSGLVFSRIIGYCYYTAWTKLCLSPLNDIYVLSDINPSNNTPTPYWTVTSNAYQYGYSGGQDLCLAKFSSVGTPLYGTFLGTNTNRDVCGGICYAKNKIYFLGQTFPINSNNQSNFPLLNNGEQGTFVGIADDVGASLNFRVCRILSSLPSSVARYGAIAYDFATNQVCVLGQTSPSRLFVLDSGLSHIIVDRVTDPAGSIVIANGSKKYLTDGKTLQEYDSTCSVLMFEGVVSSATSGYYGTRSIVQPGSNCQYRILMAIDAVDNLLKTTPDVYQPVKLNTSGQPAIVVFAKRAIDSLKIESLPICGTFVIKDSAYPCKPNQVRWDFSDGTPAVWGSDTIVHTFSKNGTYIISASIVYSQWDTVKRDTMIFVHSNLVVTASPQSIYRCFSDTTESFLHATGATRYVWHPSTGLSDSTSANPLAKPTQNMKYYVRGFDPSGCYADDSVQVYVTNIKASLSTYDTTVCAGSSVKLTAAGAAEFHWSPKAGLSDTNKATVTATPSQTTRYQVIVSEAGCPDTAYVTIHIAHKPQIQLSPSPIVCTGGSARLSVVCTSKGSLDSLGLHYSWTPSASLDDATSATPTATPLKTTRYICTVTNKFGCVAVDSVEVKVQASLDLSLSPDTLTCKGSTLLLKASGGANYSWSPKDGLNDTTSATPLCTPTHDITYTVMTWSGDFHTATCRDTATMQVHVYDFPKVSLNGGKITVCKNTSVILTCSFDSTTAKQTTVRWHSADGTMIGTGPSVEVSPDTTSKYYVSISNDQGCSSSDSTVVTVANSLSVKANAIATVLPGSAVKLSVQSPQAGTNYTWFDATHTQIANTDTTTQTVAQTTWFYVHAQRGGCEGWDSVLVTVSNIIDVQAGADQAVCRGQSVTLSVTNPQTNTTYTWTCTSTSWTASGVSVNLVPDSSRSYVVTATQGSNMSRDTVLATVYELPSFTLQDTTVCVGKSVTLQVNDTDPSDTFIWKDAASATVSTSSNYTTTANAAATYAVTATTKHGCVLTKQVSLGVTPKSTLSFSISPIDSLFPGTVASYRVYVTASTSLSQVHIRASFSVADELLSFDNSSDISGQRMRVIDTVMDVSSTQQVVAIIPVRALISQGHSGAIQIVDISSNLDPECTDYSSAPQMLTIGSVCGNSLMKIRLVDQMLDIVPNPSGGDLTIHSSDAVKIYDAVGHSIQPDDIVHGDAEELSTLHNLGSGVYFVQMRGVSGVVVKKVVVWR